MSKSRSRSGIGTVTNRDGEDGEDGTRESVSRRNGLISLIGWMNVSRESSQRVRLLSPCLLYDTS